ncbi:hypothetical protein H0H92_010144 [Tricholoma furcatifolium]|nr:hypothetical protein H0H92_010144 [Tricholoma furcatifolium]
MFIAIWLSFITALAVSATSPTRTEHAVKRWDSVSSAISPFVTTLADGQFSVNGSVFNFIGTNAYWLSALNTEQDINNTLASIRAANFSVVRTWAFNDVDTIPENGTWFQLISNSTLTINNGTNGLQKLDKVIELAQQNGLLVLLSLTNNWNPLPGNGTNTTSQMQLPGSPTTPAANTTLPRNYLSNSYGGMDTYVRNFGGPQEHDQFFTNTTLINAFMNYTTAIVTRYVNNTSVFGWELANDPRCNSTLPSSPGCVTQNVTMWHAAIASHVASLDPNHIVSSGNQGFFCTTCSKLFPLKPTPTPQPSPTPGSARRSVPEPMNKGKFLKSRKAAWKKERERQKRAGVQPDGVKIRGRWTSTQTRRQSDLSSGAAAFDGSQGVDSQDILNIPQIGFGSFQLFPDQFNYNQNAPDPSLPSFNQTVEAGLVWIQLQAELGKLLSKPITMTGFGLVTQSNAPFFVPFNSSIAPFVNDSTITNVTQPFGVTDDQRDDAYTQWIQAETGTPIISNSTSITTNETGQTTTPDTTGTSPNDGYGILGQGSYTRHIMSLKQKALFLQSRFGEFSLGENDIPKPGVGQLLVRIEAVALNPVDWKIQKWGAFVDHFPAVIGTDLAGVVEETGEDVTGFAKGDRDKNSYRGSVFQGGWANDMAGFQQYTLTNVVTTAKIPPHLSFDEAATVPVGVAAAVAGLYLPNPYGAGLTHPFDPSTRGKYASKPLIVLGGATSVGQFAIQVGRLSGFSPIITTASRAKHDSHLKSLGATHILDRNLSSEALAAEIRKITSKPLEIVYDAVSVPDTQATGYSLLSDGGSLVIVLAPTIKAEEGKHIFHITGMWSFPHSKDLGAKFYNSLSALLETGEIKPNRVEVVSGGLGGILDGLKRLELDQVSGVKLVVHPQETA